MKVAIIAEGLQGFKACELFMSLEAQVTCFISKDLEAHFQSMPQNADIILRPLEVLSVAKRFLGEHEKIQDRSRFYDLFRLIYALKPADYVDSQKEVNPEVYERLSQEMLRSLQSQIEMFEDFDIVLYAPEKLLSGSLNVNGRCLGEKRISERIIHGDQLLKIHSGWLEERQAREVLIVGDEFLSFEIILKLEDWLRDEKNRLFIVSSELSPLDAVRNRLTQEMREKFDQLISYLEAEFEDEKTRHHQKLKEWQELDDFVKVKIPKPVEPISRLVFFSGHNLSAVDELVDKNRVFATLEKPDFRNGLKDVENNFLDLKTIGVDFILNGITKKNFYEVPAGEQGFFILPPYDLLLESALKDIENEIYQLFSPAHSH